MLVELDEKDFYSLYKAWANSGYRTRGVELLGENCLNCIYDYYNEIFYTPPFDLNFNAIFMDCTIYSRSEIVSEFGQYFDNFSFETLDIYVSDVNDEHMLITNYLEELDSYDDIDDELFEWLIDEIREKYTISDFIDYEFDEELDKFIDVKYYVIWGY